MQRGQQQIKAMYAKTQIEQRAKNTRELIKQDP